MGSAHGLLSDSGGEPGTGRTVRLVLCTRDTVLGALPTFSVDVPWWPEMCEIVAAADRLFGLEVTVLRLIGWPSDRRAGGELSYLAQVHGPVAVPLDGWVGDPLAPQPLRQPWARPDGPAALLAWAHDRLVEHRAVLIGPAEQVKSWNLSALWRLATTDGSVWLKCVPDFFAHEGALIDAIGPRVAPRLLAFEPGRILMAEIDGVDHHEGSGGVLPPMVDLLTGEQARWLGRTDALFSLGLPDRRLGVLPARIERVASAASSSLTTFEQQALDALLSGLPGRIAAVEECGVPDTLVHGDFHPGNVRGRDGQYVILDWGDSAVGHPMTDELAFARPLGPADRAVATRRFADAWRRLVPGCEPDRAADLLRPLMPLLAAVQYADFVDAIEPDERIYHAVDVPEMLRQAAGSYVPRRAG